MKQNLTLKSYTKTVSLPKQSLTVIFLLAYTPFFLFLRIMPVVNLIPLRIFLDNVKEIENQGGGELGKF